MRKIILCAAALIFIASGVFADFVPPQLRLVCPEKVHYDFSGEPLRLDIDVSGTPAAAVFLVYTKDKADIIHNVQNGFLGWHLMNKVDTCVYMSDVKNLSVGPNQIVWDGKENCGNKVPTGLGLVPAGEYTYYLWGYDNVHPKIPAASTKFQPRRNRHLRVLEKDEQGLPATRPILRCGFEVNNMLKWVLGSEPTNDTLLETTWLADILGDWAPGFESCHDPHDFSIIYVGWKKRVDGLQGYWKYNWVPNGISTRVPNWGEDISYKCDIYGELYTQTGTITDGTYIYSTNKGIQPTNYGPETPAGNYNNFLVISFDGEIVEEINIVGENERRGYGSGSGVMVVPNRLTLEGDNIFGWGETIHGCYRAMFNYKRYEESGDIDDFYVWGNGQGDYIGDTHFSPTDLTPWDCLYPGFPWMYGFCSDTNSFSSSCVSASGSISFNLFGPDGLGIGNFGYAGEIDGLKMQMEYCNAGSAYDGIYSDNLTPLVTGESALGVRFCPQDSFKGVITNKTVGVEENAPVAFSVNQNQPNPFNPTTTIGFTLPDAGMMSIDVYNVAGQKVDTIVNEHMNTGSHSVVWDASGFSAGVYFYTVKFNNSTKTMKMTLVK